MRFNEFKPSIIMTEAKSSGATRYSSELGLLLGLLYPTGNAPDISIEGAPVAAAKPKKAPKAAKAVQEVPPAVTPEEPVAAAPVEKQPHGGWAQDLGPDDTRLSESVGPQILINGQPGTLDQAFPANRLSSNVLAQIQKWLPKNFNKQLFDEFVGRGQSYVPMLDKVTRGWIKTGTFGWAGGHNQASNAADISFEGSDIAGISIKADTGITLANLTPESLGLYKGIFDDQGEQMVHEKGKKMGKLMWDTSDVLAQHATAEWLTFKSQCIEAVLNLADASPGEQLSWHEKTPEKYFIKSYFLENGDVEYLCYSKGTKFQGSREQILAEAGSNKKWQRVFGDWTIAEWDQAKEWSKPMVTKLSKDMLPPMDKALNDSERLAHALRMSDQSYIYLSKDGLYLVPTKDAAHKLALKKIEFGHPDGATMKFYAHVGERPVGGVQNGTSDARVEIHIRYANGMFACNPTVRVQGLQAPEGLTWTKLAD